MKSKKSIITIAVTVVALSLGVVFALNNLGGGR